MKDKSRLIQIAKLIFAVAVLYWLTQSNHLDFTEIQKALRPIPLFLCLLLSAASLFLNSERFRHLLKTQHVHLGLWANWKLFLIGHFFNYVLPGGVGGDAVKAYYLQKENSHKAKTSPYTVLFDRFIGLYIMVLIAAVTVSLNQVTFERSPQLKTIGSFILMTLLALTILMFAAFNKSFRNTLHRIFPRRWGRAHSLFTNFIGSFEFYARSPKRIVFCFFLSLISQVLALFCLFVAGQATGSEAPLASYFFVGPIGLALSAMPISPPGGVGVGQAAFLVLFNLYLGQKATVGPTVVTIFQFANLVIGLVGLYFYLLRKKAP